MDQLAHDCPSPPAVMPRIDESREAALERRCQGLSLRLAEQTRILAEAAQELNAEILRREAAQVALLQAQKVEALGFLTSGVTHDFNTMLQAILFSYDMLAMDNDNPRHRLAIDHGRRAVQHGMALTRRLLTFIRRDEQKPEIFSPVQLLAEFKELIRQMLKEDITCEIGADDGVWPVAVDRHELETVLLNLAVNARDAMPEGGRLLIEARNSPQFEIKSANLAPGDHVVFSMRDTGTGMSPEVLSRATEIFFTTKDAGHGTGLGLAMASGFATRYGGALRIESAVGQGTLVELFLPRAAMKAPEAVKVVHEWHGGGVLLADENEGSRTMAAQTLRRLGYQVIEAGNAKVALTLSYSVPAIDLAIASITLPDGGGICLADRLRIEQPNLPVLFLVANGKVGASPEVTVLNRPFNAAELETAVSERLAARRSFEGRETTLSARMMARLTLPELKERLAQWRQLRGSDALPRIDDADALIAGQQAHHFIVAVDVDGDTPRFRLLAVGHALTDRLGRPLESECFVGPVVDIVGSLPAAYGQTARSRLPVYDWLRQSLGDGPPMRLDRLILPMSEDGHTISHLVGIVRFTDLPQPAHKEVA